MLQDSIPQMITRLHMMVKDGDRIIKEDAFAFGPGWMNHRFTDDLRSFLSQYVQVRDHLQLQFNNESTLLQRVERLPDIPMKDFSFKPRFLNFLLSLTAILVFPLGVIHVFRVRRYVKKTKRKIGYASTMLTNISTLIREPEEFLV